MKLVSLFSFAFIVSSLLVACGDDKSSSANGLPDEVADKAELKTYKCDMSIIGQTVFVNDLDKLYECDGDHWFESFDQPKSSAKGKSSSSSKKNGAATTSSSNRYSSSSKKNSSSSSKNLQSSSSKISSSSFDYWVEDTGTDWIDGKYFLPKGTFDCSEFHCGEGFSRLLNYAEFMDGRDGNVYKVARAGKQIWFAEDLRYRLDDSLYTYKLEQYYKWCNTMVLDSTKCGKEFLSNVSDENRQGLCPQGWHLPNIDEVAEVYNYFGADEVNRHKCVAVIGEGAFRTSTEYDSEHAWSFRPLCKYGYNVDSILVKKLYTKESLISVRCVKDDDELLKGKLECNEKNSGVVSVDDKGNIVQCRDNKWVNNPYRYFKDSRDGAVYRKVKIGDQWWMAENLNYVTPKSECRDCSRYGRIYPWSDVMDSAGTFSINGLECGNYDYFAEVKCSPVYPVRGICPEGWHVPSSEEFEQLIEFVGGTDSAYIKLNDSNPRYWNTDLIGADVYGFSARGGSVYNSSNRYYTYSMKGTNFWTSSLFENPHYAFEAWINQNGSGVVKTIDRGDKYYVRCVKD